MLRATTDPMVNVLIVGVALGAVRALLKGGFSGKAQGRVAGRRPGRHRPAEDLRRQVLGRGR
jgi:hypothetical protein